jgi:hypothetical protein
MDSRLSAARDIACFNPAHYENVEQLVFTLKEAIPFLIEDPATLAQLERARLERRQQAGETDEKVLHSVKLEVLMDLTFPNPWLLFLYRKAIEAGLKVVIEGEGPDSETFATMMKEKNGYDQTSTLDPSLRQATVVCPEPFREFAPSWGVHRFPLADCAGPALTAGLIAKDLMETVARHGTGDRSATEAVGYALLGPPLVLLFQGLQNESRPVYFGGLAAGFLTTLGQSLAHPWPWLPEIITDDGSAPRVSLLGQPQSTLFLFSRDTRQSEGLLSHELLDPTYLVLPPLECLFQSLAKGNDAALLQAAAARFVSDYAQATRGLFIGLPAPSVAAHLKAQLLNPPLEFLEPTVIRRLFSLPRHGLKKGLGGQKAIKEGCWPTGQYLLSGKTRQFWLKKTAPQRVAAIEAGLDSGSKA